MNAQTPKTNNQRQATTREIDIEFLFLDLNTCTRCIGTNKHLEAAIDAVQQVLTVTGVTLNVNKIQIDSEETARKYRFVTSPTLRVNGRDIAVETKESRCDSCSDLCGCEEGVECRVWVYEGNEYTEAPVSMIVEAILREIYSTPEKLEKKSSEYDEVPQNIRNFFADDKTSDVVAPSACCEPDTQESCCEPTEKSACCGEDPQIETCGCQ